MACSEPVTGPTPPPPRWKTWVSSHSQIFRRRSRNSRETIFRSGHLIQAEPGAVPIDDIDQVGPGAAPKHEQVAGERILLQHALHQHCEATLRSRPPSRSPHLQVESQNRSCLRTTGKVCEKRTLTNCSTNSLLRQQNSLFLELFSLLIRVGNCSIGRCGTGISRSEISPGGPEIAKFPVNFPVSRELSSETGSHMTAHTTKLFKNSDA